MGTEEKEIGTEPFAAVLDRLQGEVEPSGPVGERRASDMEGLYHDDNPRIKDGLMANLPAGSLAVDATGMSNVELTPERFQQLESEAKIVRK